VDGSIVRLKAQKTRPDPYFMCISRWLPFGFIHRVQVKFSDVSEEHTAPIFIVTIWSGYWIWYGRRNVSVMGTDLRMFGQIKLRKARKMDAMSRARELR